MKNTGRHHYRIANPLRFFIFILICTLVMTFAGFTLINAGHAEAAAVRTYTQVTVGENDTLWTLAARCNPDSNIDVSSAVYDICEINDVDAGEIRPGDTLFIPVY